MEHIVSRERSDHRFDSNLWKGLAAGAAGGLVAAWTMDQVMTVARKLSGGNGQESKDEPQKLDEDPKVKTAAAISHAVAGHELTHEEKRGRPVRALCVRVDG